MMCEEICKTCGADDATAMIARKMGFRPNIAFTKIKELEAKINESITYGKDHLVICPDDYAVTHIIKQLQEITGGI